MSGPLLRPGGLIVHRALAWTGGILFALVLLALAGGWLADRWLESSGGRHRLERELSGAVGSPVRLTGDYRFRLLPRIVIAGEGLAIGPDASALEVGEFRAVVSLLPLLRGELRIDAVALAEGRVDLAELASLGGDRGDRPASAAADFPAVGELLLEDIRLTVGEQPVALQLQRLRLEGIRPGRDIPFGLKARLTGREGDILDASAEGSLRLDVSAPFVAIELQPLTLVPAGGESLEIRGRITWQASSGTLSAELAHETADYRVSATLEMAFADSPAGELRVTFEQAAPDRTANVVLEFAGHDTHFRLAPVSVDLGVAALSGAGCVLTGDEPALHLSLRAAELDLARLSPWMGTGETGAQPLPELPFDFGIEILVDRASMAGVSAEGVRLVVGSEPVCPQH